MIGALIGLLVIVAIITLFVAFVVSLWKRKYPVSIATGLLLLVLFMVPLVLTLAYSSVRVENSPAIVTSRSNNSVHANATRQLSSLDTSVDIEHWKDLQTVPFEANVYPSVEAATRPTAALIVQELERLGFKADAVGGRRLDRIDIDTESISDLHRDQVTSLFSTQLRDELPGVVVQRQSDSRDTTASSQPDENLHVVTIRLQLLNERAIDAPWKSQSREKLWSGELAASGSTSRGMSTAEFESRCNYVEGKDWIVDFHKFSREHPNRRYVIGYSREFASRESESLQDAIWNANSKFVVVGSNSNIHFGEQLVVDRFSQQLTRDYGQVWRSAVLIDASDDVVQQLTSNANKTAQIATVYRLSAWTGMLLLIGATIGLCFLMNLLTQGYYRSWCVAAGSFVLTAVVIVVII